MLQIYTDGGCRHNPGLGAWAYVVVKDNQVIHTQSDTKQSTTNNEMELTAILKAIQWIESNSQFSILNCQLFTDSQYSINAITKWYPQWLSNNTLAGKKNITLIQRIVSLLSPKPTANSQFSIINCQFVWVKGHSTNPYNNLADQLVNQAMDKASTASQ